MSTDQQEDSPVTQDAHIQEFVTRERLNWTRTYFDLGISGDSVDKRPGILLMLADAERLKPAVIVFYKLDRAFRNAYEQAHALRKLKKLGIRILKVRDPNIDGPQGELIDGILGYVNQFERELTGVRIRDHNMAMAQRGEWFGGSPPYGYRYIKAVRQQAGRKSSVVEPGRLEPDPIEWPIARQIWEWEFSGLSHADTLRLTASNGWCRRNGKPWTFAQLNELFATKTYAGYVSFGRKIKGRRTGTGEWYLGKHTPMITLTEWEDVQARVIRKPKGTRNGGKVRAELRGIARCAICGAPVSSTGTIHGQTDYQYICTAAVNTRTVHPSWARSSWMFHEALRHVLDEALELLPSEPPPADSDKRRQAAEQNVAQVEQRMKRLRDLYLLGEYNDDLAEYQRKKLGFEAQLAVARRGMQAAGPGTDDLRKRYDTLRDWEAAYKAAETQADKNRVWRSLVESVEAGLTELVVRLIDLGPVVPRDWAVTLPPPKSKRPGSSLGRGRIVGQSRNGRLFGAVTLHGFDVRPLVPAGDH